MMEKALMCPQCNAPLKTHRFANTVVCAYCGATVKLGEQTEIPAERFKTARKVWNLPETHHFSTWVSIGDDHWAVDRLLANGKTCDVYAGRRARWPTELVVIKVLRDINDTDRLDNEWLAIQTLNQSEAKGFATFTALIPQPVRSGLASGGSFAGKRIQIYRWASGFYHSFDNVIRVYPQGIPPRASIWIWRRILEVLSFIHASGMVHGAVVPAHMLIQENEHGVRLIGFGNAGKPGSVISGVPDEYKAFYPAFSHTRIVRSKDLDIIMSARFVRVLLGANPDEPDLASSVPGKLAELIDRIAQSKPGDPDVQDAWNIREKLGQIAGDVFWTPQFIPIDMPH